MAGVAIDGSQITPTIKPGHVIYEIYANYGIFGWQYAGDGSTGARITGVVSAPTSKMKLSGSNVAKVGDETIEQWEAYPPIPPSNDSVQYFPRGRTFDTGKGKIISGSAKGTLEGKPIALIGSVVKTCLDTETTIASGNDKESFAT
ncbi:hypothetical protein [Cohnella terricola]|uniref:PAAR motif-containing protein n=1 Tax=Cohnella terricola TaxID=1289167 RepID=A0A559JDM1_9BACL|nr:hypothetical protein [Cohnella terricola]TVX97972.1 hypothetical protein FPZ45_17155 [Cohnella terricola]